jgi:hypothetical protein
MGKMNKQEQDMLNLLKILMESVENETVNILAINLNMDINGVTTIEVAFKEKINGQS